jgi:hypothetical protein
MILFMNNEDFMTNEEILEYLNSFANPTNEFKEWFKPPQQIGNFPFFEVIDRFVTYLYTTDKRDLPFTSISSIDLDEKNQFLLNDNGTLVYLTSPPPFVENFVYTVTMTQENAYLVSNLNFCTAEKEGYPSRGTEAELVELIKKDLAKTDPQTLKVTFDEEEIIGSFIVRKKFLEIKNTNLNNWVGIPAERIITSPNNTIHVVYGGFWFSIPKESLTPGDHIITMENRSLNWRVKGEVVINNLV